MLALVGLLVGMVGVAAVGFVPFRVMRPRQAQGRLTRDDLRHVMRPWHTAILFFSVVALGAAGTAADDSSWLRALLLVMLGVTLSLWIGGLKLRAARQVVDQEAH